MSGSVSRSGSGWQYVIDAGLGAHGKRRQHRRRGFATKRLAQEAMVEAQSAARHGELVSCGRRTIADYLEQWLAAVQASLEPAGYTNYRTCLTLYVLPRLGHVQLAALTPLTLSSLYADLLRAGGRGGRPLSNTTVRLVHGVVRNGAQRRGPVGAAGQEPGAAGGGAQAAPTGADGVDAGAGLRLPRRDHRRPDAGLLAARPFRPACGAASSPARPDPALISSAAGCRSTPSAPPTSDYQVVTKEPKASSRRAVALAAHTVAALRRHSAGLARERLAAGAAWTDSGLVFVDELGRGLHPQRLTDLFQQASDAAGLPRIRLHDLRHTSATLALVAGVHPKIVQERLGHATISMTLDTYSHVLAGMQHEAAAQVEALLLPRGAQG